ncbi:MAG: hypothetical protein NW224_28500 [Leptolyngbyaceae cyanobacterium bins.302]|nr:hypothetical protein [Leptolyngbyaceae cyanobacterium bins.302]
MGETDLPEQIFPVGCPYALSEILSDRFYPGESSSLVSMQTSEGDFLARQLTPKGSHLPL